MKVEEKELLFKDLCSRLPYDCKVSIAEGGINGLQWNNVALNSHLLCQIEEEDGWEYVKPYLRPMSSMTEEEKKELQKAFNIKSSIIGEYGISSNNAWWVKDRKEPLGFDTIRYTSFYGVTDYLNSIHVDYRGLIEKGLAIEVEENNNPYKDKL